MGGSCGFGELLRPITAAMGQELLKGDYIQADETRWICRCMMAEERTKLGERNPSTQELTEGLRSWSSIAGDRFSGIDRKIRRET